MLAGCPRGGWHSPHRGRRTGHRAALAPSAAPVQVEPSPAVLPGPRSPRLCPLPQKGAFLLLLLLLRYFDLSLSALGLPWPQQMCLLGISTAPAARPGRLWPGCTVLVPDAVTARRGAGSPPLPTTPPTATHGEPGRQPELSLSVPRPELKPCCQQRPRNTEEPQRHTKPLGRRPWSHGRRQDFREVPRDRSRARSLGF